MGLKGLIAATASVALIATPTMAASTESAAAAQAASSEVAPSPESVNGMQAFGGSWIIIFFAVVAVALGIWALLDDNGDSPSSP